MDESRQADLKAIDKRLAERKTQTVTERRQVGTNARTGKPEYEVTEREVYNPKLDKWGKENAAKAKATILAQSKDKKLRRLREQLIRAAKAHDKKAELAISAKIKRHEGKPFEDYS